MFEQLINDAASRLNLSTAGASALVRGLLGLMTNERTGGVEGFVDTFRRVGLGDVLTSWYGGKEGKAISPAQVESALGIGALDRLAVSSGLTRAAVSTAAAYLLPKIIGRLTPNGVLPSNSSLLSQVSRYVDRPVPAQTVPRGTITGLAALGALGRGCTVGARGVARVSGSRGHD